MAYHVQATPPGSGQLAFDAISDMTAFDATKLAPGVVVSVLATGARWQWWPTATLPPTGSDTVVTQGGVWILLKAPPLGLLSGGLRGLYPSPTLIPASMVGLPTPLAWFVGGLGLTLTMSAVTATGPSPPTVTLSGTPIASVGSIEIDIDATGLLGVSTFTLKVNGVFAQPSAATGAAVLLGNTGITAAFSAGTYTVGDVYKASAHTTNWADQSGNGNDCPTGPGGTNPTNSPTGGPNGGAALVFNGTLDYLQGTFARGTGGEVYVLAKFRVAGTTGTLVDGKTVNTARFYRNTNATQWSMYAGTNGDTGAYLTGQWNVFSGAFAGAGSFIWTDGPGGWQSGNSITADPNTTSPQSKALMASNPAGLTIGSAGNGSDFADATIAEVLVFSAPLTTAQRVLVANYFQARTQAVNTLIFDGNSFLTTESMDLPIDVQLSLNSFGPTVVNNGVAGDTTPLISGLALTETDPFVTSLGTSGSVAVVVEGTNDIYYGATAAQAFADLQAYVNARLAHGFQVVVTTILSRSNPGTPANFNVTRAAYNALVVAAYGGGATPGVQLANWASDPNMGINGAETNLTYFQADLVHPNVLGCSTLAAYVTTAIQAFGYT